MKLRLLFVVMITLAGSLLGSWPHAFAQTQQNAVSLTVRAGYDGSYRSNDWFPVTIDLVNNGADLVGELEWTFPAQRNDTSFRTTVDLPRGAQKRVTMSVFSRAFARSGEVSLIVNNTVIARTAINIDALDDNSFVIAVASSDPTLLSSLDKLQVGVSDGAVVRHIQVADLPDDVQSLRAINALFLHDVDTSVLNPQQRAALSLWVALGGQLIVSGGTNAQATAAGVADLLPASVGTSIAEGDLGPLLAVGASPLPSQATRAPLNDLQPLSGSEALFNGLAYRHTLGSGTTTVTAFDAAVLRGWQSEPKAWLQVLQQISQLIPGASARSTNQDLVRASLQLPGLGLPSAGVLLLFLVVYILILGPINYFVLRRLGRLEWAWLSVPVIVLIFSAGLYLIGFGVRGGQSAINQITVVQSAEGRPRSVATAFVGVFSPQRATYSISFPPRTLVHTLDDWDAVSGSSTAPIQGDSGVELPNMLIDVRSVRTVLAEATVDQPAPIESQLQSNGAVVQGEIRNTGAQPLDHVLVVQGSTFVDLGTIAPGSSRSVDTSTASGNFPWGVDIPQDGVFNRQTILTSLFSGDYTRYASGSTLALGASGVYVVAWSNQPTVRVRVDGQEQPQTGHTLYVVKLRS